MSARKCTIIKNRPLFLILFGFSLILTLIIFFGKWSNANIHSHKKMDNIRYVLQWTLNYTEPFDRMGVGCQTFIKRNCSKQNCLITNDRSYLRDLDMFDAILFHGPEISREIWKLPYRRSAEQKYVFASMESSHYYPISKLYNNFFNWTWTYKLDSDLSYAYLIIRDKAGNIIGPNKTMHWMNVENMQPTDEEIKSKLNQKSIAAAWFVSNCNSNSKREHVAKELTVELKKYNLTVDIYGKCGNLSCPINSKKSCLKKIEQSYFFYLAFENSFSEDYVTEKLLNSLQYFAIPVVYGRANYTRFMPDGIYLDANKINASELAKQMHNIINDKELYYSYFKWHNHFSYHDPDEAPDSDEYCNFCAKLNDEKAMNEVNVYSHFVQWWSP